MYRILLVYGKYSSSYTSLPWALSRPNETEVDVLCAPDNPVQKSVVATSIYIFPKLADLPQKLIDRLSEENYSLVIYVDEAARDSALTVIKNPAVAPHAPFSGDPEIYKALENKTMFYAWCVKHGIPTPKSIVARNQDQITLAAEQIGFPLMLKASKGSGGQGIYRIESHQTLSEILNSPEIDQESEWILQEYVSGPVGSLTMVCLKGRVTGICSSSKYIALKDGLGPSALRRFSYFPEARNIAEKVAAASGVTGITGFDWMEYAPGKYYVIDPHLGRCTTSSVASFYDGLDLGNALLKALEGDHDVIEPKGSGRIVWMMPQAIELFFQGKLFYALKKANPLNKNVHIFWGNRSEWRMLISLYMYYFYVQTRILLGRLKQKLGS